MTSQKQIRNFSIISHINHGKSTLADRFLEITKTVDKKAGERILDSHPIEKERGITIKLAPVRMKYSSLKSLKEIFHFEEINHFKFLILNLIDTPGHVDFTYEVSRSLNACEGAVLLVDASAGIQAQTVSNTYLALENNLEIIPVVNKIDLPIANPEEVTQDLVKTFGFKKEEILFVSAKTGEGVKKLLDKVVEKIPPPNGKEDFPLRALVFNSFYHPHKGVIVAVRIVDGSLNLSSKIKFLGTGAISQPLEIGYFTPNLTPCEILNTGEVGYVATGLKEIEACRVGDTITKLKVKSQKLKVEALVGYKRPKAVVFLQFYPVENKDFPFLKKALEKLKLNDASLSYKPVSSSALGSGFQLGFLGVLHAQIVQERLERDFNLELVAVSPSVEYQIINKKGEEIFVRNPSDFPKKEEIVEIREPYVRLSLYTPTQFLGEVLRLCQERRGKLLNQEYFASLVRLQYSLPMMELISGFFDQLKSVSSGFASFDWELEGYKKADLVKLDVFVNKQRVDALSLVIFRKKAQRIARNLAKKLKEVIPRQLFEVPIQVGIGGKIVARETTKAYRKDVTAKLYGGDQTRKDKLLKKQKKGKKRLKQIGKITLPQEAFLAILETN